MRTILIASTNDSAVSAISGCLSPEYHVEVARDWDSCLQKFLVKRTEFLFIDISMLPAASPGEPADFSKTLEPFRNAYPTVHIIVITSQEGIRQTVNAVKAGADDYLTSPISPDEVTLVIESSHESLRKQTELEYLRDQFWKDESLRVVHTLSPEMKKVFDRVRSVAPTKTTVLLTGETGTGKGILAQLIHLHSNRAGRQFISIHCGAIPDTLIESELFGHEKGAFTGAYKRKLGKFEIAQSGTIFLDEIGTITQAAQIKLLQVLQEKTFGRVGGESLLKADVRVIAASNEDLLGLIDSGRFRKDLYYRLNVFPIEIPPLRERIEDIPFLVQVFLDELNRYHSRNIRAVHPRVMQAFRSYHWPGNIRELENVIERAYIIEPTSTLTPESFPVELFEGIGRTTQIDVDTSLPLAEIRKEAVENIERQYLKQQLGAHQGRIDATAAAAGISTRQLHKLLTKYDIRKFEFKPARKKPSKKSES